MKDIFNDNYVSLLNEMALNIQNSNVKLNNDSYGCRYIILNYLDDVKVSLTSGNEAYVGFKSEFGITWFNLSEYLNKILEKLNN